MKKRCFAIPDKFGMRMMIMLTGIVVQAIGWALLMKVDLGIDPYGTFATGVADHLPVNFGTVHLGIQMVMLAFVLRYNISLVSFGTLANMFLLGYVTDFFTWVYELFLPIDFFTSNIVRYLVFMPGLILLLLGAALYISSGLGVGSYDAIPAIIEEHLPKISYRTIRLFWDGSYAVAGFLIGSKVGVVTIGIALLAGTVISAVQKQIEKILFSNV